MNFTSKLRELLLVLTNTYNSGNLSAIGELVVEGLKYNSDTITSDQIHIPKLELTSKSEAINYLKQLMANHDFRITKTEILAVGKTSKLVCYYDGLNIKAETEIRFNEYGKILEINISNLHIIEYKRLHERPVAS